MGEKHFLDTSVLRASLVSPQKVKEYYKKKLRGKKYISDYIEMEFLRGFIRSVIDFYFLLSMPQYDSFYDALNVWSNKFQPREQKNILQMLSNLLEYNQALDDKDKSLRIIAEYIRRLVGKMRLNFKKIGNDNTYCKKAKVQINFNPNKIDSSLCAFLSVLKDNVQYKKCEINNFIKQKHKENIKKLIKNGSKINKKIRKKKGFDALIDNIQSYPKKGITCSFCSKIGDIVIALLVDTDWTLEHTDYSFNYLCEILKKKHRIHPYDKAIMDS